MKRAFLIIATLTLTLNISIPTLGIGLIIIENADEALRIVPGPGRPPHWEHPPFVPSRPIHRLTPLEIRSVKATAKIKDQLAQTRIEQEFYNPNPRQLEGTFLLPLPKGAHLEKFRMEVNGKMMDAELLSAAKAKGIYEEIVRKAKDPALLEYVGRDLLKVRIFPIEPNSTKKIEVSYTQLLKNEAGLHAYSLPLNTTKYCSTPVKNFSLKLELESATPLKTIYSPTHSIEVIRHATKTATIGLEQQQLSADKDFELFYSAEKSELGLSYLTYRKPGEDGYFMLFASPGFESAKKKTIAKDVIFVLDTSGSMSGKKLEQAKKALTFCIENLNEEDRFEVIRFSTETEALFRKITLVTADSREKAVTFVRNLKTIGGTAIYDALRAALETETEWKRPKVIVFLTDGLPTVGESSVNGILETVKSRSKGLTRIFTFGVGTDVNTHLLDLLAEETRAVSQYVLPDEDTEVKLSSFFSKINDPVLADLSLDFGTINTSHVHPGRLPDLFKDQQLIVLGRFKNDGKTTTTLRGKIGEEDKRFGYEMSFPRSDLEHEFIPRLWATRRVGYLLEEIRHRGENAELKEEVTELARQYGIVTPYTSYLVTEDQPVSVAGPQPVTRLERLGRRSPDSFGLSTASAVPQLNRERLLKAQANDLSGDAAVAGARYNYSLKSAQNEQEVLAAPAEVRAFVNSGQLDARPAARQQAGAAQKFVGQRTFRLEQGIWTDTTVIEGKDSPLTRIAFDSKEYWDLAAKFPELREILALGTEVKFRLGDKIYEVYTTKN